MNGRFVAVCIFAAALAVGAAPARADEDAVQFFRNLSVTPDSPVHDAVCFFCGVNVEGKVDGDIVVFFGNIRIAGEAHQDVVDFFGNVTAAGNSSIGGDLVSLFGSVRLGENVRVGKDVVAIFGRVRTVGSSSVGGDRVTISPWIFFVPFLVILLVILVIVHEVQASRRRRFAQGYPMPPRP